MEQMPSNAPVMQPKPGPAGWLPVWIKAITRPNEQTFVDITESPDANSKTAFIWIFIVGTLAGLVQAIMLSIYSAMGVTPGFAIPGMEQFSGGDTGFTGASLITSLCLAPVYGLISVVGFAIGTAIIQWIAKLFGGRGTFDKLAYGIAAISVPVTLVSLVLSLFGAIPFVGFCTGLLSFGLLIYAIVLEVMAVKAVNRFGWGPAAGSVLIPFVVVLTVCACVVIAGLMVLGPAIGNVFSEINQSLAP